MPARGLSAILVLALFAGCIGATTEPVTTDAIDVPPKLGYEVPEPDMSLVLEELDLTLPGVDVLLHARIVKPEGDGPFPVIVQFTPYTAPGQNVLVDSLAEPLVPNNVATFDREFVRRGFAFAYADVRGTGDSTGCLDLRGPNDIADLREITKALGEQPWSNGKVGFIGASYPGSEAHMAAIAADPHLAAVIPVVASTSFYHYHHNDGVPYTNHAIGSTNTGYTQNAIMPTLNPHDPTFVPRYAEEAQCPYFDNMFTHGGLDQTGAYYDWWQERNLRAHAANVTVPVLMAQGLADWNVKPDHIATWFNDLKVPKTLIMGQWGHQYPRSPCEDGQEPPMCDNDVPYGDWWEYASAFFDTYLKGVDTGMFTESTAWIEDNGGNWHRSASFPILDAEALTLHLTADGSLASAPEAAPGELAFYGCPDNARSQGVMGAGLVEGQVAACRDREDQALVFESEPFAADTLLSGVPLLRLVVDTGERDLVHLVAVLEVVDGSGKVVTARDNYGYLNPVFRNGLLSPEELPAEPYAVTIDLYPQEDLVKKGQKLRLTLRHDDEGRTIEVFDEGETRIVLGPDAVNSLTLPLRPAALVGTRLA